ncbi:MAG: hypothetical protein IJI71_03230 [Clostridia bacterium]|nr:hypothetical protein [Eggerthellaceae bacterium]MBQ6346553.1 hypothetical protein [Clostridia bacterium]
MNLKEIIEATLIELDRGTEADTVAMYAKKFTMYANEAVNEIARRFKACMIDFTQLEGPEYPGFDITSSDFSHACKRITKVLPADYNSDDSSFTVLWDKKPLHFEQFVHGAPFIHVWGKDVKDGDYVAVEYLYVPTPMDVSSLENEAPAEPDSPDLPTHLHELIPLYVRAREQCGQDPSTQGTSSAYFSLFNQKVYQLQRETLATPDSFQFKNYHFE